MIGQAIKEIRMKKGINCSELARLTGHPKSTVYGIETEFNQNPSFKTVCSIADKLGVSVDYLRNYAANAESMKTAGTGETERSGENTLCG